ncbi:hypothetical protein Tco_1322300 [Tanacetum coccineum]
MCVNYLIKNYLSKSGRRHGKQVFVEPDDCDNAIDVNNEPSDDDFVEMRRSSSYGSGLRSGRNKDKEVYDADHDKSVALGRSGALTYRVFDSLLLLDRKSRRALVARLIIVVALGCCRVEWGSNKDQAETLMVSAHGGYWPWLLPSDPWPKPSQAETPLGLGIFTLWPHVESCVVWPKREASQEP